MALVFRKARNAPESTMKRTLSFRDRSLIAEPNRLTALASLVLVVAWTIFGAL